jgi:hypothetical protein
MTGWRDDELEKIEAADELEIASVRSDGTLGSQRTIWVVRVDDDLYVRSVNGRTSDWFRGTQRLHEGRIRAGGVEKDDTFVEADTDLEARIDEAYRPHTPTWVVCSAVMLHLGEATGVQQQRLQRRRDAPGGRRLQPEVAGASDARIARRARGGHRRRVARALRGRGPRSGHARTLPPAR